ncbi:DUF3224 domain-containing protein [Streptomyces sp. NPDC016626]|uniref:DUF3224 domain-containing protein n=1 Tax=Streptomyces sp. NPDC016626 TaxID=3364968 RepID=UPI0037016E47
MTHPTGTTGAFAGTEPVSGRAGTFVLEERGRLEADGSVRCSFQAVEGSGTEGLTGPRGAGGGALPETRGPAKAALCTVDQPSRAPRGASLAQLARATHL